MIHAGGFKNKKILQIQREIFPVLGYTRVLDL